MFDSLSDILGWKKGESIPPKFHLVKDCLSNSGDFVLVNALSTLLHAGESVVFISIDKSKAHYAHIMKKVVSGFDSL